MFFGGARTQRSRSSDFDDDAQAFFTAIESAGGSLSGSQKTAINTYVVGLKADNLWTKLDRWYINVGGTAASHAICLVTRNSRVNVNSVTAQSGGTLYNGVNNYFRCDIAASGATKMTTNDGFGAAFIDPLTVNQNTAMGSTSAANNMSIQVGLIA